MKFEMQCFRCIIDDINLKTKKFQTSYTYSQVYQNMKVQIKQ